MLSRPPVLSGMVQNEKGDSRRLHDMAHFLEVIRNLQYRLGAKFKKPSQGLVCYCVCLQHSAELLVFYPLLTTFQYHRWMVGRH